MSRIKLSIALIFTSTLLAACGGGGGSDSASDSGTTITASSGTSSNGSTASNPSASGCAGDVLGKDPVTLSLDELPYCDPAPLVEMMAMDDPAYNNMLANDWAYVEEKLYRYIPPNVTVYPAPRSFIGVMTSCLQQHGPVACREYMSSLIGLNNGKKPQ